MNPDDVLSLLPPLPSLEDLATTNPGGPETASYVKLTDDEFRAALKGEVSITHSVLSLPEIAEVIAGLPSGDAPPHSAAEVAPTGAAPEPSPGLYEGLAEGYARAAALRYTYLLDSLTPAPSPSGETYPLYKDLSCEARDAVFAHLTGRSEVVTDAGGKVRWMLCDDERREALRGLIESGLAAEAVVLARRDATAEAEKNSEAHAASTVAPNEEAPPAAVGASSAEGEHSAAKRIEETLWGYLTGRPRALDGSERRQLLVTQRVVGWLHSLNVSGLPTPEEVSRQLARETLLQPFRHLTGDWNDGVFSSTFEGREMELRRLYNYLSVLPPESFVGRLVRTYEHLMDAAWRLLNNAGQRPVLIHGPGGVGKSTLLAKFLLDHLTETKPENRFPYAYLDFDLSSLTARDPLTLLAEAARQLAAQYPSSADRWSGARTAWLEESRLTQPGYIDPMTRIDALDLFVKLLYESESDGHRVSELFARGLPFLLVLDTFEELQYHDRDSIKDTFRFLNIFRDKVPALRCVMMGRAPLSDVQQEFSDIEASVVEGDVFGTGLATDFDVIEVPLGDLDQEAALGYLSKQGISDDDLAEELVEVIGSNPLSLRLIVRVFKQGRIDLKSLREETKWRRGFGDWWRGRKVPPKAVLQGVLFDRILGHIHTPEVKKLAHPGLVLRRITPDLIKEVLAGPCGLPPLTDADARWYYDMLAREVSLVGTDRDAQGEDVLRHRVEIRRIMLRLMSADEAMTEQIWEVHENARRYYETRGGRLAAEEALYHSLMLGKPPRPERLVDDMPTDEAVEAGYVPAPDASKDPRPVWRSLAKAVEELPVAGAAYLAARLQQELVDDASWESVDRQDWELMILARASRRARARNNVASALEGLRREQNRMRHAGNGKSLSPLSPLPLIEVALLERLGRYKEALSLASSQLRSLHASSDDHRRIVEYNLLSARLAARLEDDALCERSLLEASHGIAKLQTHDETRAGAVNCCERQFIRFATDCDNFTHPGGVYDKLLVRLLNLLRESDVLRDAPVLTRYAVTAVSMSKEAAAHRDMLQALSRPETLRLLFTGLTQAAADRIVRMLTHWMKNHPQGRSLYDLLRVSLDAKADGPDGLYAALRRQVLQHPERLTSSLADYLLELDPTTAVAELCMAFRLPRAGTQGEDDPVEEARLLGDLIPGEGPSVADGPQSQKMR